MPTMSIMSAKSMEAYDERIALGSSKLKFHFEMESKEPWRKAPHPGLVHSSRGQKVSAGWLSHHSY